MTSLKIQYELKKKEITQKSLAAELDVSEAAISSVILKKTVSDPIMKAVAAAIGKDYRLVFPEYYLQPPKRSTSKAT